MSTNVWTVEVTVTLSASRGEETQTWIAAVEDKAGAEAAVRAAARRTRDIRVKAKAPLPAGTAAILGLAPGAVGIVSSEETPYGGMDAVLFDKIQGKLHDAMPDIFDAYITAERGPPDHVVEAFADMFDCSPNEFKKFFAKYARSKGSNLFFAHYPAFGQPGCEFDPPASAA